jgi:2-polyprenyl-6-methoxyphenol hydroxylase-like FAD-dependent oxidoreductase
MSSTTQHHFLADKHIIVSGAGIGGTVFCIALQQFLDKHGQNIQPRPRIDVYERETSADVIGREGYSLSIRGDALARGLQTLQKLGMLDEMIAESNPGTHFTLFNADFTPLMETQTSPIEGLPQTSMRIARAKLRQILINHMPPSVTIHWNCGITSAHEQQDGKVLVDLENGNQEQCDLLIAADGSNSKIRRTLRPQHELTFVGAVSIMARTHPLEKLPPPIDVAWGRAFSGSGNFLFIAPSDRTSVVWIVSYLSDTPREAKVAGTMSDAEIDQILAEAEERTKSYSEPMPTVLKHTLRSSVAVSNAKDLTPFRNHGSVIFIGDAQHAISSFGGNGANMAIMDGYQLAEQLVNANSLTEAIKGYDDQTVPRSTNAMKMSHRIIEMGHSLGSWNHTWQQS